MSLRAFLLLAASLSIAAIALPASSGDTGNLPIVAQIGPGTPDTNIGARAFLRGMSGLGYVDGRNVRYDMRGWGSDVRKAPAILDAFVRENVSVIEIGGGNLPAHEAQAATKTIPIVFGSVADPVADGLVASIARPGGNMTGLWQEDVTGKRLQLLKDMIPNAKKVAVLAEKGPFVDAILRELPHMAERLDLTVRIYAIEGAEQIAPIFNEMAQTSPDAIVTIDSTILIFNRDSVVAEADKAHLPLFCTVPQMAEAGCVMSYAADLAAMHERAAYFVDKILKGANPGDLPIEQPTRFALVLNVKAAGSLGISVPNQCSLRPIA